MRGAGSVNLTRDTFLVLCSPSHTKEMVGTKKKFFWRAPSWKCRLKLSVGIYVAPFMSNDPSKYSRDTHHIQPLHTSKHTHSSYTSSHSRIQSIGTIPARLCLWVQFGPLPKDTDMLTGQARNSTPSTEPQGLLLSFSTSQLWLLPRLINSSSWQVPDICLDKKKKKKKWRREARGGNSSSLQTNLNPKMMSSYLFMFVLSLFTYNMYKLPRGFEVWGVAPPLADWLIENTWATGGKIESGRWKKRRDFLLGWIVPFMLSYIWEGKENETVSMNQLLTILVGMMDMKAFHSFTLQCYLIKIMEEIVSVYLSLLFILICISYVFIYFPSFPHCESPAAYGKDCLPGTNQSAKLQLGHLSLSPFCIKKINVGGSMGSFSTT